MSKTKKEKDQSGKILFRKVRFAGGRVNLHFTEKFETHYNELTLDMAEEPMDSFKEAMSALAEDVIEICEIPDPGKKLAERIEVHTINIKYETEKEIPGAVISFKIKRQKKSGVISINTPYQLLEERESGSEDQLLKPETAEKIHELLKEASLYYSGKRKQIVMEFKEESADQSKGEDSEHESHLRIIADTDYVVKTDQDLIGVINPGHIISLSRLVNISKLLSNGNKKGIYHLNPGKKINSPEVGKDLNAFTFKRNGEVLILTQMMEDEIESYSPKILNSRISELLNDNFKSMLKEVLSA